MGREAPFQSRQQARFLLLFLRVQLLLRSPLLREQRLKLLRIQLLLLRPPLRVPRALLLQRQAQLRDEFCGGLHRRRRRAGTLHPLWRGSIFFRVF